MYYDLRNADLKGFEKFVFDHPYEEVGSDKVWYHQFELEIDYDPARNAALFIELFENSSGLLAKYEPKLLEQGCWAMFGAGFDGALNDLIWDEDISTDQRLDIDLKVRLIQAMFHIFDQLFSVDDLDGCGFQWWDGLAYDLHPMKRADPDNNPEHFRIREAMFETLRKILGLDNRKCQLAALHGMNHVAHPNTAEVINIFIRQHPDLSDNEKKYAQHCMFSEAI